MELELHKYSYHEKEYVIYDSCSNYFLFDKEKARIICQTNIGVHINNIIVCLDKGLQKRSYVVYNPDGTLMIPTYEHQAIYEQFLIQKGYVKKDIKSEVKYCSKIILCSRFLIENEFRYKESGKIISVKYDATKVVD